MIFKTSGLVGAGFFSALCGGVFFSGVLWAAPDEVQIASLIRSGNLPAAQAELEKSAPTRADRLFFEALVAQYQRRFDETVRLLDQVLIEDPNHLNAKRELARTLFLQKKYGAAERRFRDLLIVDAAPENAEVYRGFINEINARRPYGLSGTFSFLPSSNVSRGTENLVFDSVLGEFVIDPRSRAQSGLGVQAGLSGFFRLPAKARQRNTLSWGVNAVRYEDRYYNATTTSLQFSHERVLGDATKLGVSVFGRYSARENDAVTSPGNSDSDNHAVGVSLTFLHILAPKKRLLFRTRYEDLTYENQPHNSGPLVAASLEYLHQKTPSLGYTLGAKLAWRDTPKAPHSSYLEYGVNAGVTKEWSGGYLTGLTASAGLRDYKAEFPLSGKTRADSYVGVNLSLQNNNWNFKGFVPKLTCGYTNNHSNISFYDYDVTECNLSVTKRF